MYLSFFYLCLLSLKSNVVQSAVATTASLSAGTIQGVQCDRSSATAFLSIPYAQPPIGNLRFAPPQAFNTTYDGGTYQATKIAPSCIQFGNRFIEFESSSEDCLYLDLWMPQNITNTSALPVKTWIYGGAETAGSISDRLYDGCNLAAMSDSIVVSINYRLGPLGWLSLPEAGIDGNFGIQDIIMGLEWIQSNIAAFGGDAKKVLLFGQSAGAANTYIISSLPQAPSLIKAAIMESGGGRSYPGSASSNTYSAKFAGLINCTVSDIDCFRSTSLVTLNTTMPTENTVLSTGYGNSYYDWGPYVDGRIIPVDPGEVGSQVPAIFGSNTEDGTLFVSLFYNNNFSLISSLTSKDYNDFLRYNFGPYASAVENIFPLDSFTSTLSPVFYAIAQIFTNAVYLCPAYRGLSNTEKNNISAWTYRSNHSPSCPWFFDIPIQTIQLLGPTHTSEIPFVFANTDNLPLPNGNCSLTSQEKELSAHLVSAWTSMAASGSPASSQLAWPAWNSNSSLGLNIQNSTIPGPINYTTCGLFDTILAAQIVNVTANGTSNSTSNNFIGSSTSSGAPLSSSSSTASSEVGFLTINVVTLFGSAITGAYALV